MNNYSNQLLMLCALVVLALSTSNAQNVTYNKEILPEIEKSATVNFNEIEDPYLVSMVNIEAPSVSGNSKKKFIAELKKTISELYPKNDNQIAKTRDDALPPTVENGFISSNASIGIPLDNTLAMNGDQIISAVNFHLVVKDTDGTALKNFTLSQFAASAGIGGTSFDPRLLYDTESDRFVLVMLNGFSSDNTNIIIAFSQSGDATQNWNVYRLEGNVNNNTTWTDFPMITITETDLIITGNLLRDGETWQEGFDETILWQIDKQNGYSGEALTPVIYKDIEYNGFAIRNLCPAESGDEVLEPNCYFLSNRNFSVESDSFFLVELTGGVNDPNAELTVDLVQSDQPYGAPPNAEMRTNVLQTNDARVLEVFYLDNELQFVGNTRNLTNNKAGIYHGRIMDLSDTKVATLTHIIGDTFEIGYPGISYTGIEPGDRDAIINFNHSSVERDPGLSALYFHPEQGYSDMVEIWKGSGYINMINGPVQRWGDYSGSQRDFNDGESCWVSGFYGAPSLINFPWVAKLKRPQGSVNIEDDNIKKSTVNVYPNPISTRFIVEFDIPQNSADIAITLFDNQGRLVAELLNNLLPKSGSTQLSFDQSSLPSGIYNLVVTVDRSQISSKQIIKN